MNQRMVIITGEDSNTKIYEPYSLVSLEPVGGKKKGGNGSPRRGREQGGYGSRIGALVLVTVGLPANGSAVSRSLSMNAVRRTRRPRRWFIAVKGSGVRKRPAGDFVPSSRPGRAPK
jgi:hypothetical protein